MIVFDLFCDQSHTFEGWFRSSTDFEEQKQAGLMACPICGSEAVNKAPMAPAVPAKASSHSDGRAREDGEDTTQLSTGEMPEKVAQAFRALAAAQAEALRKSEWVGDAFAESARKMHYGEAEEKPIHGRATGKDAQSLVDEGIAVAPLLVPFTPPEEIN